MPEEKKHVYDCIVPLGNCCAVANELKQRSLRACSLPFDWLAVEDDNWLSQSLEALETHFSRWFAFDNLKTDRAGADGRSRVIDAGAHRIFLHDFYTCPVTAEELAAVRSKYERRIERLYQLCNQSKRLLFVVCGTQKQLTDEILLEAYARLAKCFPNGELDIFAVIFESERYEACREQKADFGCIYTTSTLRPFHSYDLYNTTVEWAWLDTIAYAGEKIQANSPANKSTFSRGEKMVYKLYKHLKKWLIKRGRIAFQYDD